VLSPTPFQWGRLRFRLHPGSAARGGPAPAAEDKVPEGHIVKSPWWALSSRRRPRGESLRREWETRQGRPDDLRHRSDELMNEIEADKDA